LIATFWPSCLAFVRSIFRYNAAEATSCRTVTVLWSLIFFFLPNAFASSNRKIVLREGIIVPRRSQGWH
jgi:hypothetical protein